jgi:hypothetical protein
MHVQAYLRPALVLLGLSTGWPSQAQTQAPPTFQQEVDRYSAMPTLGPSVALKNWQVPVGNLILTAGAGTVTPLLSGGTTIGYYFQGKGNFSYTSDGSYDRPTLVSNHAHNLSKPNAKAILTESPGGLVLSEELTAFTLWFQGKAIPLPTGEVAPAPTREFARDWAYFQRDGLGDRGQDFAIARADAPTQPLVRAEIQGADAPFLYTFDPGFSLLEQLSMVGSPAQPSLYDGLRLVTLSKHPLGWNWETPLPAALNLTQVDIDLHAGLSLADLHVKETLVAGIEGMKVLPLDLYTMLDPAEKLGAYQVRRVLDAQGRELPFQHRRDRILVALPQAHPAGEPFTLTFEYGGRILLRPNGDNYWQLGVEPWFPQPELAGQYYTVHALIRTPKEDVPIACGTTLRRTIERGENLLEVRIDKPVQFFSVFAGAYKLLEDTKNGLTIRVATYGGLGAGQQPKLLKLARQTIDFYQEIFEPFPFSEFNIVQVNSYGYGQAPPGMMIITNEAFNSHMDDISRLFIKGINQRFAHEIAHQYFGHLVKMPSSQEQWITESFANYASALALRSMKNQGESAYEGLLNGWRSDASAYAGEAPIPFANRLRWLDDPQGQFLARTYLLYEKGGLILAALHKDMGDRTFALFMKSLLANFRWKFLTTQSVEQMASMAGKKDYAPLFRTCYWGTQMPPK